MLALPGAWYVACFSRHLRARPVARTVGGTPLALFRDGLGRPRAVLDRCPHRNVPLSYGTVRNYLASAVMKVGGRNRVDAVRIAREADWL